MAKLLGGYISVKSEYNKGSIFTMHHPINLLSNSHNVVNINTNTNIKGKILIVDDNGSNLSLLQMLMEHFNQELGYDLEVHAVGSGYEAIKICQINHYNLIFMDINMIGMDGCTTCKMIKKDNIKIIATTGNILAKNNSNNKYSCFDDILIKPYDNTMVLDMIKKYLN
jgi:CheY-like chemotaxis protein